MDIYSPPPDQIFSSFFRQRSAPVRLPLHFSRPMTITATARDPSPPPALPPPRNVEELGITHDTAWPWLSNPHWSGFKSSSVKPTRPSSSRHGSNSSIGRRLSDHARAPAEPLHKDAESVSSDRDRQTMDPARRGSSISTVIPAREHRDGDEGSTTSSDDGRSDHSGHSRLHSERQLEQRTLDNSSHAYDRNLLSKIGGPQTPGRSSLSYSSATSYTDISTASSDHRKISLKPLTMPERTHAPIDTPTSAWPSAISATPESASLPPFRSPRTEPEISRPAIQHRHTGVRLDDAHSHRGSRDEDGATGESQLKGLNIHDRSPSVGDDVGGSVHAGMKRRTSSPHRESSRDERTTVGTAVAANDLYQRRSAQQLSHRTSPLLPHEPAPTSHAVLHRPLPQHHGSVSSTSSYRNNSLSSSYGLSVASSVTSVASGRLSPSTLSPAIDPELNPPFYNTAKSVTASPSSSVPSSGPPSAMAERAPTSSAAEPHTAPRAYDSPRSQGVWICDCCPKKPKKFGSEEELRLHHMEKQYTCAYCPNRFKNKNEAERHQNSLHLRRHSWSCAALPSIEAAFYVNSADGGKTDVCGFCGDEFANPADWHARREHVNGFHKFGECNQAKKFFRADHFRQHLKHSHAGTSGKWTNILENACMKDEPAPQPREQAVASAQPKLEAVDERRGE